MFYIKFLSGPLAGQSVTLKPGRNVIGRAPHCDVVVPSHNVSKEHVAVEVYNDKVIVTDLNSRNGTFVNGIQIKSQRLTFGDKISLFDIIIELKKKKNEHRVNQAPSNLHKLPLQTSKTNVNNNGQLAYDQFSQQNSYSNNETSDADKPPVRMPEANLKSYIYRYFEDVVLPGVYKLNEWMEFRWLLAAFVGLYVVFVTSLSTVPLVRILKSSIEKEAQNRAQTIARSLVRENTAAIIQGQTSLIKTDVAEREPGVNKAFIISNYNGDILAPIQLAGQHLTDVPFVHEARKSNQELVSQVDDSTIVAVAPISFYKSETGSDTVAAHAVVVYNMGALAVDGNRTLSLFIQVLFIAILLGGLLYYFLFKLIVRPIHDLNRQVDTALREGTGTISIDYKFQEIQKLANNINSAVSRGSGGFAGQQLQSFEVDRSQEMRNIVNLVGFPAIAINSEKIISEVNAHFTSQINPQNDMLLQSLHSILDQSLRLNLEGLFDRIVLTPSQLATDTLEIQSQNYDLSAQAVMGSKELSYVIVVFVPRDGEL